jgi:hypothetical protein
MLSAKLPARLTDAAQDSMPALARELILWTTRDGREIPLDDMTDDHIANALRVLTIWRSRIKKEDANAPIVFELRDAIDRFKGIQRQRRKAMPAEERSSRPSTGFGGRGLQKNRQGKSGWGSGRQGGSIRETRGSGHTGLGKRSLEKRGLTAK